MNWGCSRFALIARAYDNDEYGCETQFKTKFSVDPQRERGEPMTHLNRVTRDQAVEQSLDAAIELDEFMRGDRKDAPALDTLRQIITGSAADKNSQTVSLYHRAFVSAGQHATAESDWKKVAELLNAASIDKYTTEQLILLRDFCLGLNEVLIAEAFNRIPRPPLYRSQSNKLARADGHQIQYPKEVGSDYLAN